MSNVVGRAEDLLAKLNRKISLNASWWTICLFCLLLATDLAFIFLHVIFLLIQVLTDLSPHPGLLLTEDHTFSEVFQYVKAYWIALLLGFLAFRKRSLSYFLWSLLFLYILLDDSLQIHENLATLISTQWGFPAVLNLRPVDLGELVVFGSIGLFFLVSIWLAYRLSDRASRKVTKTLILFLFALALCGLVFDLLHIMFYFPKIRSIMGILEDGGELIVMSAIASFAFELTHRETSPKR